jgi:parallel beta-helix repeat protein
VKSIDPATRTVTLARDCSYAIRPADRYYFQNALEELDSPGEWYFDKRTATLYFWPPVPPVPSPAGSQPAWELRPGGQWQQAGSPVGSASADAAARTPANTIRSADPRGGPISNLKSQISNSIPVFIPTTRTILQVLPNTTDLTLRGLTFECSEGTALTLQRTKNCTVAACTIRNVGDYHGSGVSVSDGTNNRVAGCDISFTGSHGISLSGGDRPTLTPANNVADNNYIHHVGVFYKQGVGVSLTGVGNAATHNLIHDTPRMGIMFSGNNLLLEYNEIRHANLETEDTGAVYTGGRDWISSRGTIIRYNYFHDILGYGREGDKWLSPYFAWGVYLDDNTGGVDVIGNIVVRAHRAGLHLHNGRDNLIENNIFVDASQQQFEYNGWTDTSRMWKDHFPTMVQGYESVFNQPAWKNMRHMDLHPKDAPLPDKTIMAGNVFQRNIVSYHDPKARLFSGHNVNFAYNTFDNNLYFHAGQPLITGTLKKGEPGDDFTAWQRAGRDTHSAVADPLFVDAAKDDYRLEPESPALKLGFKPIPVEKIGPYKDDSRASWPIKQAEGAREKPL